LSGAHYDVAAASLRRPCYVQVDLIPNEFSSRRLSVQGCDIT
jgi:hypothetical protein